MPENKPGKPTQLGNLLGALFAVWLVVAVLAVASVGVYALVAALLQVAK